MAATGLLGMNPYYKGTDIDVSKPVNLAIQLEQKERAKQEALDKYFMDYEKSLNPAGMRQQDQDVFLKKLAENKAYYLKNRDCILQPAKCGAEAQSQYMSNFKNILSDIDKSKQLAANGKVIATAVIDAKKNNRTIPKEITDAIYNNELSMGDSRHQAFDPVNFDAYDKHDSTKYQQSIYSKIKPTELQGEKVWNKSTGDYDMKVTKDITKDSLNQIQLEVGVQLQKDRGLQDVVRGIMTDQNKLSQVAQAYKTFTGKEMKNTPNDVALAYTIALKPNPQTDFQKYDDWKGRAIWQQNYEDQLAKKAVQGLGNDIIKTALSNPHPVVNNGKNEVWHDLSLSSDVMKDFTIPGTERTWAPNPDYRANAKAGTPQSEQFIPKPGTKMVQLPVSNINFAGNKIYGSIKPVDASGNPVAGKADQIEIPIRVLASKIVKANGVSDSKSGAAIDQVEAELKQSMKNLIQKNEPSKSEYSSEQEEKIAEALKANKRATREQIIAAAKAAGKLP
jgi:hypothetical protein